MQPQTQITNTSAKRHKGVLPRNSVIENSDNLNKTAFFPTDNSDTQAVNIITSDNSDFSDSAISEQPLSESTVYPHIRHPKAHHSGTFIVMAIAAVCGVAGGIAVSLNGGFSEEVSNTLKLPFGEIFLMRLGFGAALLAVEFILGFFAFGDLLVWAVPLIAGLGLALRVAITRMWVLLPSSAVLLGVAAFGAAVSAGFSGTLMSLSRGGTIHLGNSPRRVFVLNFLGYFAAAAACALYEGIILTANR